MKRAISILALSLMTYPAAAELIKPSYTERVLSWDRTLNAIGDANNLEAAEIDTAKKVAAGWVYVGPCEGRYIDLRSHPSGYAISVVTNPDVRNRVHAAILQMVAVLSADNLGRKPSDDLCRFAKDLSNGH